MATDLTDAFDEAMLKFGNLVPACVMREKWGMSSGTFRTYAHRGKIETYHIHHVVYVNKDHPDPRRRRYDE